MDARQSKRRRSKKAEVDEAQANVANSSLGRTGRAQKAVSLFPLTNEWQGWAEIESDPAFFNVMLKELGVHGISVKEIFSLDDEMLASLPRPAYGVIFLFRWREDEEFTDTRFRAGSKVWFANQTVSNACASYALLNIVNNIPNLELGPQLQHFKDFTIDLSPPLRGDAVSNFDFMKRIHNSFARRMDKLGGDLHMSSEVSSSVSGKRKRARVEDNSETAHHFMAFMPINSVLWKMDGLEYQPRSLGKVQDHDWLQHVKKDIEARMARYDNDQIDFAILGLVEDPLRSAVEALAQNVRSLQVLNSYGPAPTPRKVTIPDDEGILFGPDPSLGLSTEQIEKTRISQDAWRILSGHSKERDAHLCRLIKAQRTLRLSVREEQEASWNDQARASRRRHDCSDAICAWLQFLLVKQSMTKKV